MPCSWEGNRRSGIALAMRHRQYWYYHLRARQRLCSADRGQLQTPRYRLTTSGGRSFTCAAPSIWDALPDYLKDTALSLSYFEKQLKTFLFFQILTSTSSAPEVVDDGALYKFTFYLLTYGLREGDEHLA